MVDQHEALALVLRSSSSERLPQANSSMWHPLSSQVSPLSFFPKETLNRSRNPIPVWRKSQIFRLQLTDNFGPFNVIIQTFGKLQLNFQPNLNHLDWISEPKVMSKILTDVQTRILIRIGLGFNWVSLLLNSCLAGCKLA